MSGAGLRNVCALLLAGAIVGVAGRASGQERGGQRSETRGVLKSVDAGAATITISPGERAAVAGDKTYTLGKDVEVAVGSGASRTGPFQAGKLADLHAGLFVSLSLSADQKTVEGILVEEPVVRGILKAVDAANGAVTIVNTAGGREREVVVEEKTYALAPSLEVGVDDGRGRRFSLREGRLSDVAPGAVVSLRLSLDGKHVRGLLAEGATLSGLIKAVDVGGKTVTLFYRQARGDDAGEERTLPVAGDAVVLLDDGKGRRLSLREGTLNDVPVGASASVKLSADQKQVKLLRVEGPSVAGLLKWVDPDKRIVAINVPRRRGEDPEEKSFAVAADVRVVIDGNDSTLAALKPADGGPVLELRLSLDQKMVQAIIAGQARRR